MMRAIFLSLIASAAFGCAQKEIAPGSAERPAVEEAPAIADESADGEASAPSIPAGELGGMCGGIAALQCVNEANYCSYAEGECVSVADAAGSCAPKPDVCTMDYNPVCGCDGNTYPNACAAASAGTSVASRGECGAGPVTQ